MDRPSGYAFSDLSPEDIDRLMREARREQQRAIRSFLARVFRMVFRGRRKREAQVWPPKTAPALSLNTYC